MKEEEQRTMQVGLLAGVLAFEVRMPLRDSGTESSALKSNTHDSYLIPKSIEGPLHNP